MMNRLTSWQILSSDHRSKDDASSCRVIITSNHRRAFPSSSRNQASHHFRYLRRRYKSCAQTNIVSLRFTCPFSLLSPCFWLVGDEAKSEKREETISPRTLVKIENTSNESLPIVMKMNYCFVELWGKFSLWSNEYFLFHSLVIIDLLKSEERQRGGKSNDGLDRIKRHASMLCVIRLSISSQYFNERRRKKENNQSGSPSSFLRRLYLL